VGEDDPLLLQPPKKQPSALPKVNLYDPVATLSRLLTRRFGIVGGLGLVAVLAATEGVEILRALNEDLSTSGAPLSEELAPETVLSDGTRILELKPGVGTAPKTGDFLGLLISVSTKDKASGETVFLLGDEKGGRKASLVLNKARKPEAELAGLEQCLAGMKRGGVRKLLLPPGVGLGVSVANLPASGLPGASLAVTVTLEEVSPAYFVQ
jgi:hypothetical protein